MNEKTLNKNVILSGAHHRGAKMCGVEGSLVVWQRGGSQPDPSTVQDSAAAASCFAQDDNFKKWLGKLAVCFALLGIIAFSGCDQPIQSQYFEQINVASFIYAGEAIDSVVLHRTTPFGDYYDDLDYAVDSALVIVTTNGVADTLLPATLKGRYYLPASKLIVQGGQTYMLSITAANQQTGGTHYLTSTTTVPMPIHLGSIADSIRGQTIILDTNNLANFAFLVTAGPIDEPSREYLLSVTALDTNLGRIHVGGDSSAETVHYSNIATGPEIALTSRYFTWYGPSLITFYAIDTNFADYQRQLSGGGDYVPTLNHINGGIGVFASAAIDTVSFIIKPKN
jgi:Domain of unknown function (DUF4249)